MGEKTYRNANEPKELFKIEKGHLEALENYSDKIEIKNILNE